MTPLSRLLQGCKGRTSGARMPSNPTLLNVSVGHETWESWDTAKQREKKIFFCHQDTIETSRVVGNASAETWQRVSSNLGLGSTYFALLGG